MGSRVETGLMWEARAKQILETNGYVVESLRFGHCLDLRANKNGFTFEINVKSGNSFGIDSENLNRMVKNHSSEKSIPSILFINEGLCYLFALTKTFQPPANWIANKVISTSLQENGSLKCHRCGYNWFYRGKNIFRTSCPDCRTSVQLK